MTKQPKQKRFDTLEEAVAFRGVGLQLALVQAAKPQQKPTKLSMAQISIGRLALKVESQAQLVAFMPTEHQPVKQDVREAQSVGESLVKTLSKYTQLNYIGDIWEPHYSSNSVYIASWKVKRSKLDIKLSFSKVSDTSEWAGQWFLARKNVTKCRKKFDNNGLECYVVPLAQLEQFQYNEREEY